MDVRAISDNARPSLEFESYLTLIVICEGQMISPFHQDCSEFQPYQNPNK